MDNDGDSSFELPDSSVCRVCQSLGDMSSPRGALVDKPMEGPDPSYRRYRYIYMHHPSIAVLVRSAEAGCSICTILRHELRRSNTTEFDTAAAAMPRALTTASTRAKSIIDSEQSDDEVATHLAEQVRSKTSIENLDLGDIGKGRIAIQYSSHDKLGPRRAIGKFSIMAHVLNADSLSGVLYGFQTSYDQFDPDLKHRPSRHLLSDPHIGLIQHWRDTCKDNHASCRTTACDPQLPSRLLELDRSKDDGVRLIETHGMKGEYACLSYCWGVSRTQAGQTKGSNLSNHLKEIPLSNLPNTVVDTIRLCHKLGFQYLWVDRLCIIQDDQEDWKREASKMCDIYSKATLTISAPICSDSTQSLITERYKWWFQEQSHVGIMEFTDEGLKSKRSLWLYHRDFSPKDLWTFEQVWIDYRELSKGRASHWSGRGWTFQEWMLSPRVLHIDMMTFWDCFEGYANELDQRRMRAAYLLRNPEEFGKDIDWNSMVEEYSKRNIAFEKDRMPALAGLAERYRLATNYTYLAGTWLEDMPLSLLWQADHDHPTNRRELANQTTPSWSWAHCSGPVTFVFKFDDWDLSAEASIKSHHCRYEPPSSISTVVKAWIDVDGSLRDVTRTRRDELLVGNEWWDSFPDEKDWGTDDAAKQGNVKLLLIASVKEGSSREEVKYAALILQSCRSKNVGPLCFRRVGIALLPSAGLESEVSFEEHLWKRQIVRLL